MHQLTLDSDLNAKILNAIDFLQKKMNKFKQTKKISDRFLISIGMSGITVKENLRHPLCLGENSKIIQTFLFADWVLSFLFDGQRINLQIGKKNLISTPND